MVQDTKALSFIKSIVRVDPSTGSGRTDLTTNFAKHDLLRKLSRFVNYLKLDAIVEFLVDAFQLKESLLTPDGPVYTTLLEQQMH